jgi:hypothetical protein
LLYWTEQIDFAVHQSFANSAPWYLFARIHHLANLILFYSGVHSPQT